MIQKYSLWIEENYNTYEKCKNKCNYAVRAMVTKFPELQVQVGLANGVMHCWAIDEDSRIVDPTYSQFECASINYVFIADRFLKAHEYEASTGAIFLDT